MATERCKWRKEMKQVEQEVAEGTNSQGNVWQGNGTRLANGECNCQINWPSGTASRCHELSRLVLMIARECLTLSSR
jgi:hypothetical protein